MPLSAIAEHVWRTRYRHAGERSIDDTWRRVARAVAAVEERDRDGWEREYYRLLHGFEFLPGGRILAGAGTGRDVTLFNCFVMGTIEDSVAGVFASLEQGARTMLQGGGVGYDFSTLRPAGMAERGSGRAAVGPVRYLRLWDSMCETLLAVGARRGAMMGTLRCDHPDVEGFVDAKRTPGELRQFNLSVLVSDAFMRAVESDAEWPLVYPTGALDRPCGATVIRAWPGHAEAVRCTVVRTVRARALWERIMRASYEGAEPGVLFVDRINRDNNLAYRERIGATNPCGEVPLPPHGACNLGSLNLTRFVDLDGDGGPDWDLAALQRASALAVRFLDDVTDVSGFALPEQAREARTSRRIGLGVTGLADALLMLGLRYDSPQGREAAARALRQVCHAAYRASSAIAREKGSFPALDRERYLAGPFARTLPQDVRDAIARQGLRNSHLIALAPAGSISLLAGNVSSGVEPVHSFRHRRELRDADGQRRHIDLDDPVWSRWRAEHGNAAHPAHFVTAQTISPRDHLAMAAALQPYVDNAISKTVNVPADTGYGAFASLYEEAYALGLKGCTAYRAGTREGAVIEAGDGAAARCARPGPACD